MEQKKRESAQNTLKSDRLPPHDIAAEEAFIGAILIDEAGMAEVSLKVNDFYHEPHMIIYKTFADLVKSKTGINRITVAEELDRAGKLEQCGGVAYLLHLISVCPSPLDSMYYAEIIKRASVSRQLIAAGEEITDIGYTNPADVSKTLTKCDDKLAAIRKSGIGSPVISPKERAEMLYQRYSELYQKEMVMAINTGISKLDVKLGGGFYNGDVIIVGARTSMGKTTFLQFIAQEIARDVNVLFCSAEMNLESISDREVAQNAGIPTNRIRLGRYDDETYAKIVEAVGEISSRKVYLYDETPMTTDKILQAALNMKMRHGLGAIVIDYLGMLGDDYGKNPYERISYISRKIKELARIVNVPVIVAHQLSRELEKRDDKRPQLFDLRDSGNIEQDADIVLFLYRESYYNKDENKDTGMTEIIIAKQRQGDAGKFIKVYYDKLTQAYYNSKPSDGEQPSLVI